MLTEPTDLVRLVEGLELAIELASSPAFGGSYRGIGLLDPPRRSGDREVLEGYIKTTVGGWYHACGTCRMGARPGQR